ncbi:unnamed protein product [Didymodactylos carnosus]|uniref:Uncharacterized protein n=1 Tax=Didymodactylos carnosus TaxID=1234261 RepID=A0A813WBS5_9BILA|nr:unnamed protein product [Didymodactylos carnosus]CAF3637572.1 unnamed protein product [Didymodactylos carnosus]
MDAAKAGVEKIKETVTGQKAQDHLEKASDPNRPASDRIDHALDAGKQKAKEQEHCTKADCHAADHKHNH